MLHQLPPSLRLLAGTPTGDDHAILVHGISSQATSLQPLAQALVAAGHCDAAWGYDSWAYWGQVTRAMKLRPSDALDLLSIKKILGTLGRAALRRAAMIVETPSEVIEGAAQEIAGLVRLLEWQQVTLIGHSLGGLVARCAVEAHDLSDQVASCVTLATPHRLWSKFHRPEEWEEEPHPDVRYLQIVGSGDWVVAKRDLGNFTSADEEYGNLTKVLYTGLDHGTVHSKAQDTEVADLILAHGTSSLHRKEDLMVLPQEGATPSLVFVDHSPVPRSQGRSVASFAGQWLEFA